MLCCAAVVVVCAFLYAKSCHICMYIRVYSQSVSQFIDCCMHCIYEEWMDGRLNARIEKNEIESERERGGKAGKRADDIDYQMNT